MAEQDKKLPDIKELLQVKQSIRDSGSKADMDRVNDLILKRRKLDEGSLVQKTDVTGAGGKELFKVATPGDQTFKVKVGKPDAAKDVSQRITGVTQKIDNTPIKVGTKDIFGTAAKKAAAEGSEGIASTVAKKAGKFLGKGRLAGVGAFLGGLSAALRGEQASAGEMALGAGEALAPAGVSEALQSESLGPSLKSADIAERAAAKLEGGFKLLPEEQEALRKQREQNDLEMQKYRVK